MHEDHRLDHDLCGRREPGRGGGSGLVKARNAQRSARRREAEARTLVFVYGTLLFGECNHRHLTGARLIGAALTRPAFRLYDLGPFPGLVAGGKDAINGEVYAVDEATLAALDRLEDRPRFYRRASLVLADGAHVETYLLPPEQVAGHPVIRSGSWRARRKGSIP
jgi:gamma-glutamylaminecyclotransferase